MNWFNKLKIGLNKSSQNISNGISGIFDRKKLDSNMLEELEDLLITADIGPATAADIVQNMAKHKFNKEITTQEVKLFLADELTSIFSKTKIDDNSPSGTKVILLCGVNGSGKTTSIGKLANFYQQQGKSVSIAACDTFRAAAVDQIKIWANKNNCPIHVGSHLADPASVAYEALHKAKNNNNDILLIDTAGRLHNKTNLMEELAKIVRVLKKIDKDAPHESILVLDGSTGQNALNQLEKFSQMVRITSIIITKLDGSSKGGIAVALVKKFNIPIFAIGVGEQIDDLRPFHAKEFSSNLVGLH